MYYDLVFVIKAQGNLDAMAIQRLYLSAFMTTIHWVDETAVLLLYKSFFALNEEVLYKPNKLRQSYTAISKYFQGFRSQKIGDRMYVSVLAAYNASPEIFYKNLNPGIENLGHGIYTCSIQVPFISKLGWLFHSHEHTNLRHLTELLEPILHCLNPDGPPLHWASSLRTSGMVPKLPNPPLPLCQLVPPLLPPLLYPGTKLCGLSMLR